ncbi:MAG: Tim44 domain-containing protein [Allorhizobium sp.]
MQRFGKMIAVAAVALSGMLMAADMAEARRAGGGFSSFGSRGTRTFSAPPTTRTAPAPAAPIERTMTPKTQTNQPSTAGAPATTPGRGFLGGFGGSMIGGLMMGGLIGMMLGNGIGGGAGFLGLLLQGGLILGAVMLAMRFFGRGQSLAMSGAGGNGRSAAASAPGRGFAIPRMGSGGDGSSTPASGFGFGSGSAVPSASRPSQDITVAQVDLERFETMLKDVQAAYGAEDYAALRRLTTPEAMSYLAEELSENATRGVKNEVRDVHLVQGDAAEAWREDGEDYATVAMRYESIDVMRERATGRVVSGDPDNLSESVELWTFVRKQGGDWLVSAIQSAGDPR